MSETTARVVVAIPWIVFAIAIVGAGGAVFAAAMIVLAVLGLREFFLMAQPEQPIMLPGYAVVAGMVIAAHYGTAFQIVLVFAALFPLAFAFAALRRSHEAITPRSPSRSSASPGWGSASRTQSSSATCRRTAARC